MRIWTFCISLVVLGCKLCEANFNLFLTEEEVRRILGLEAELYYVREGVVNEYAMGWTVKVAPDIHTLYFQWQALTKRPILYNVGVWVNETIEAKNPTPLAPPYVNISLSGTMPKRTGTFELNLPCTGLVNGEVDVIMNLNVTSPRPNQPPTVIYLKRKKICLKGISSKAFSSRQESPTMKKDVEEEINENLTFDEDDDDPSLLLYLSCGAISLAFVLGVISGVAIWRRKIYRGKISTTLSVKDNRNLLMSTDTTESKNTTIQTKTNISSPEKVYTGTMATTLPTSFSVNSYASIYKEPLESKRCSEILAPHCHQTSPQGSDIYESSCCSNNSDNEVAKEVFNIVDDPQRLKSCLGCHPCYCEVQTRLPAKSDVFIIKENFKQLQMDRTRVRVTEVIQEGVRGRLYRGWLQREHPELDQQVLVKTLRESSDIGSTTELCQEGTKLAKLRHSNLLTIVGLSIISNAPPFLVYPDPLGCNFKLFLKSKRFPLKISEIIEVSMQASKGISFLHANNILHEDIATRNCFLCDNFQIRLTDCALSKEFFPEDYENLRSDESHLGSCVTHTEDVFVPLRWMAIETLTEYTQTSTSSDVWSLGIFLWEISSQGEHPYSCISPSHLLSFLREEHRLRQPPTCPDELFRLMNACWSAKPQQRPSALEVNEFLQSFRKSLKEYV